VRNGTTNAPNLFKNVPKQRIQAGRGNSRKLDSNVGLAVNEVGSVTLIENNRSDPGVQHLVGKNSRISYY
jgi:hypothetical protein